MVRQGDNAWYRLKDVKHLLDESMKKRLLEARQRWQKSYEKDLSYGWEVVQK